jgi:hypothetical protein
LADGARPGAGLQEELAAAQPGQSLLGELLMRKMCHRAAAVQKRLEEARQQGLDLRESDEKVDHPSLVAQQAASEAPAGDAAGTATQQADPAALQQGQQQQQQGQQQQQQGQQAQAAPGAMLAEASGSPEEGKGVELDAEAAVAAEWSADEEVEEEQAVHGEESEEEAASEHGAMTSGGSGGRRGTTGSSKGRGGAAKLAPSKRQRLADL